MNPTPEQVAQWAREAGVTQYLHADESLRGYVLPPETLNRLVTRAYNSGRAEQAEADAAVCELWNATAGEVLAKEIRANAPKVTT